MSDDPLRSAVREVLEQGRSLLRSVNDEVYRRRQAVPQGASLGAHYRHVLDHFQCLLQGLQSGQIDYDQRGRNPQIENSTHEALVATEDLISQFDALPGSALAGECTVIYSVGYGDSEGFTASSNVAREIMFCVGHAIHHYAILKLVAATAGVALPYEFGVAPSTLKHLAAGARH